MFSHVKGPYGDKFFFIISILIALSTVTDALRSFHWVLYWLFSLYKFNPLFHYTVNSEIFARDLFLQNSAHAEFRGNKNLEKLRETLCHLLMYVNHAYVANFLLGKYVL